MNREQEALDIFKTKIDRKLVNCAQAILMIYDPEGIDKDSELFIEFRKNGYGKAPGKVCGAYYAASYLLNKYHPDKVEDFERWFAEEAGDLVCKKIRKAKRLSCEGCVEKSGLYLNEVFPAVRAS
ncbi:MAG: C-GCAxxG-C-C family (seleno)protein [Spirochaetales bacterium]|nr:C-GCAxxG-C-C family (seleno)protein [Spirochaetales bacterium]